MLKDEEGAVAVEMAFVAPVLFAFLMAVFEFGLILFAYEAEQHVTWNVARQVAANRNDSSDVPAKIMEGLPKWVSSEKVSVTGPVLNNGQYTLTVSMPASAASPTAFMSHFYGEVVLSSTVVMQKEPTP